MSRFHSYISSSVQIISDYKGAEPFSSFIKKYFTANKKYGSKDRKAIAHLCFCYFRLGKSFWDTTKEERILIGLFLCSSSSHEILLACNPGLNEKVTLPLKEKLKTLHLAFQPSHLFSYMDELSSGMDADEFALSHFTQPNVFIRIRPNEKEKVLHKLQAAQLPFQLLKDDCIALPNTTKIEGVLAVNKEIVIQDYNSQRVGDMFQHVQLEPGNTNLKVWDCCAASGGKSIMAYDQLPNMQLTVSDIRESILSNLKKRFAEAGISGYKSFISNLSASNCQLPATNYNLIIADVPCSGSGTWGRTPEQLQFFTARQIKEYASLQKKIVTNIISSVKQNGYLLYITCSVFQKENEEVVSFIEQTHNLQLVDMKLLKGYSQKADTMFAALLIKK